MRSLRFAIKVSIRLAVGGLRDMLEARGSGGGGVASLAGRQVSALRI
jgi:ATP-dependent Lon protease